ncbi:MAG: branched chain amino acid aminotransferase, partial [Candidatus Poseidoniaceae archaeon]
MSEAPVDWDTLTFSMTETDFMYMTKTAIDAPWEPGEMRPYGNISISPAAGVMNYGQGLFEGMKAY